MPNYAPRISIPFETLEPVFKLWAESCTAIAVYEHDADEEIQTTHCHVLMIDCKYSTAEALKRVFYATLPGLKAKKGNDLWAWAHKDYPNPDLGFITYMSKGKLTAKLIKNIPGSTLEELKGKWVEADKPDTTSDKLSHKLVQMVITRFAPFESFEDYIEHKAREAHGAPISYSVDVILKDVRSASMRCFWERTREAPHASQYKKVAGTAFLHICEKWHRLEQGLSELQNLWY
jgi:hypothetical protein